MKPERIKALLKEHGATQSDVARVVGVSPSMVGHVIEGRSKSRVLAMTIADFLDLGVDDLWPGMYPKTYSRRTDVREKLSAAFAKLQSHTVSNRATAEA
jgi:transcriptional regulator with XRE-family HTH domain